MATVKQRSSARRAAWALLAALGTVGAVGCGDPLADNQYRGVRLWQISGGFSGLLDSSVAGQPLRLALFFSTDSLDQLDPARLLEHRGASTDVQLGGSYVLGLFEPPGESLMVRAPDGGSAGYAIARLIAYADTNHDRQRQVSEPLVAVEPTSAFMYLPQALPAGRTPTRDGLPAGMLAVLVPQPCGMPAPPSSDPGDCGVPLGADCRSDADCNMSRGGLCLKETNFPWPGGYCTIAESTSAACHPGRAVFYRAPRFAPIPPGVSGYYLRSCTQDSDCSRMQNMDMSYECDLGLRGCRPRLSTMLRLRTGGLDADSFCGQGPPR